jgi:hypothetical protein
MRQQGFACLRGGRKKEKGGFRKWAAASRKLSHDIMYDRALFIGGRTCDARQTLPNRQTIDRIDLSGRTME